MEETLALIKQLEAGGIYLPATILISLARNIKTKEFKLTFSVLKDKRRKAANYKLTELDESTMHSPWYHRTPLGVHEIKDIDEFIECSKRYSDAWLDLEGK